MALSCPLKEGHRALPLSAASVLSTIDSVMSPALCQRQSCVQFSAVGLEVVEQLLVTNYCMWLLTIVRAMGSRSEKQYMKEYIITIIKLCSHPLE